MLTNRQRDKPPKGTTDKLVACLHVTDELLEDPQAFETFIKRFARQEYEEKYSIPAELVTCTVVSFTIDRTLMMVRAICEMGTDAPD